MASEYQTMPHIIDMMRMAKKKSVYSDATLVANINSFSGRGWAANYITLLFAGTIQPTADTIDVFTKYLLKRFYDYCSS